MQNLAEVDITWHKLAFGGDGRIRTAVKKAYEGWLTGLKLNPDLTFREVSRL